MAAETLLLGAVAYDPKVVTIWEGFRAYFDRRGLSLDYILFSNYERQVAALLDGVVHVAWNSPLAWLQAERLAKTRGVEVQAVAMRDTDRENRSVIIGRSDGPGRALGDLRGRVVAVGALDSPQATLIPLSHLKGLGLQPERDFQVVRFEVMPGLHGDHVGGERDAARTLVEGRADAACMHHANYLAFLGDGLLPPLATIVLAQTGAYDHCNMTLGPAAPQPLASRFAAMLLEMSYEDPEVRPLFDLEGLRCWVAGRTDGYGLLGQALEESGFWHERSSLSV